MVRLYIQIVRFRFSCVEPVWCVCVCCVRCARRSQISANSHVHEMLPWHAVIRHAKQNPMAIRTENGRESDRRMQNTHFMPLSLLVAGCWLLQQIQQYKLLFAHSSFADIFCFCIVIRCHCLSLSIWLWQAVIGRERMSCPSQSIHGIRDKRVSEYTTRMPSDGRCCVHSHHMDEKRKGRRLDKKHADAIRTGFSTLNASRDIHRNTEYFPKNGNFWSFWPSAQYIHLKDRKKHIRMKSNSSSFRRKQTGNPQNRKYKNKHGFC